MNETTTPYHMPLIVHVVIIIIITITIFTIFQLIYFQVPENFEMQLYPWKLVHYSSEMHCH